MSPEDRPPNLSWWNQWGKSSAYLLLGIVAVVAAVLLALIIVGVIF